MQTEIRKIRKEEIHLIRNFPPKDWIIDIEKVYNLHYVRDYFYPIVATIESEIVGTGIAIINGNASWLGTIIVPEKYRNQGIGKSITNHLIEYSKSRGAQSIILIATELGMHVYKKIGFEHDLNYLVFKADQPVIIDSFSEYISEISTADYNQIFELDYRISGEKRSELLMNSIKSGFKFHENSIQGFYLPDFGQGLIIADTELAGIELLKFKILRDNSPICIPETNICAQEYLKSIGYYMVKKIPRMFLNRNIVWDSKNVYSRGSGYMG